MTSPLSTLASRPVDATRELSWRTLQATAAAVRAHEPAQTRPRGTGGGTRRVVAGCVLAGASLAALGGPVHLRSAVASGAANSDLFALTNQDRSSNGVGSLQTQPTLAAIGEGLPYRGCGFTVYGRAQDMINRNYFAHPILGCGQLVFAMMQANRVDYLAAGENIGWASGTSDAGSAAQYINTQFMNSPEHRANILNRSYTHLGIGSAQSNSWSGAAGGPYANVWMFGEEFAQLGAGAPPASAQPAPTPTSTVRAATAPPPPPIRNDPPPAPPGQPPLTTAVPPTAPASLPPTASAVVPNPTQRPGEIPTPPILQRSGGFLSDSVEAVLEAYLVD